MEFKIIYGVNAWLYEVMLINVNLSMIDDELEVLRTSTMLEF